MKGLLLSTLLLAICTPSLADIYSNKFDPMTDKKEIDLGIFSNETNRAQLAVFCNGGSVKAVIGTDDILEDFNSVLVRWDKNPPQTYYWNGSGNRRAFILGFNGFTGRKQANKYVKKFREHSSMLLRYSNFLDEQETISFDLKKFHPLLDRAESEGCSF